MKIKAWIEAMRLRTLPVSISGVLAAFGFCFMGQCFNPLLSAMCLAIAVLAQISSNFANEYFDFKAGIDKPGREGPRRGVTEGDISPRAMLIATFATLGLACAIGLWLSYLCGLWLILVGALIALGVIAYSAGPYPLSHHGLGEVAVVFFFGIIPVNFTFYVQGGFFDLTVFIGSVTIGLMGANVLIVNNYRDMEDDAAVHKHTLAVRYGRVTVSNMYLLNGFVGVALMLAPWLVLATYWLCIPVAYLCIHTFLWIKLRKLKGQALNPLLGMTAVNMLFYALGFLLAAALSPIEMF